MKAHAQQTLEALKAAKVTIITAESCTAETIAALLAQAEGAGDIPHGGFITYTKEHKVKALGVAWRLLKKEGAEAAATRVSRASQEISVEYDIVCSRNASSAAHHGVQEQRISGKT